MSNSEADIRSTDMSEEMQKIAIDCATQALNEYSIEHEIAEYIKNGSYVSHEPNHFIYFYLD
ncbi:hypothetical protein KR200_005870 [Drosophila serrata]|nr:hypothetical protein KR200_005870 [Drosophila serrata]